jgi:hypothetical protein
MSDADLKKNLLKEKREREAQHKIEMRKLDAEIAKLNKPRTKLDVNTEGVATAANMIRELAKTTKSRPVDVIDVLLRTLKTGYTLQGRKKPDAGTKNVE